MGKINFQFCFCLSSLFFLRFWTFFWFYFPVDWNLFINDLLVSSVNFPIHYCFVLLLCLNWCVIKFSSHHNSEMIGGKTVHIKINKKKRITQLFCAVVSFWIYEMELKFISQVNITREHSLFESVCWKSIFSWNSNFLGCLKITVSILLEKFNNFSEISASILLITVSTNVFRNLWTIPSIFTTFFSSQKLQYLLTVEKIW